MIKYVYTFSSNNPQTSSKRKDTSQSPRIAAVVTSQPPTNDGAGPSTSGSNQPGLFYIYNLNISVVFFFFLLRYT